ncbi:MAG: ABC transporter [Deltaproteobacteria bacterium]|nr:MAG: ABC transporter [Deltaproteobacteria bacterium]
MNEPMKKMTHWAIDGSGLSMEADFMKRLLKGTAGPPFQDLAGKTGALFSTATLNHFIKEEAIHDDYTLSHQEQRSIQTFSSGEQKKALLNHLLSRHPDFLILDNPFDMLDAASQSSLRDQLHLLSEKITLIQIFRRKESILPFIHHVLQIKDGTIAFSGTIAAYLQHDSEAPPVFSNRMIPPALGDPEPVTDPLISFQDVSVLYGEKAIVNHISWEIRPGDFWQLVGPNGSGKTTLLTLITGDNPKAYGQNLMLFGRKKGSGESVWDIKKKIGYVTPAMTVLFGGRHTVESMITAGLYDSIGLYKKPSSLQKHLAGQWIDLIGLTDFRHTWFSDLSEDQQCMVLIARAMIKHPPLLILDEPTHGLNDAHVAILTALVNKIGKESRTAIIYVSHRNEKGLFPRQIFELIPGKNGSEGRCLNPEARSQAAPLL